MKRLIPIIALLALSPFLGGCPGHIPATVDGECKVFSDPGFAVQGKRLQDRRWIGATQEKGIDICRWKRPQK